MENTYSITRGQKIKIFRDHQQLFHTGSQTACATTKLIIIPVISKSDKRNLLI